MDTKDKPNYKHLDSIDSPADLKEVGRNELPEVCSDIRAFLIDCLANNPGHFGASLGVIELTVALHYVYNTPYDKIVWDVGHQAYGHKILTGRRDEFNTNRKLGGISGFPNITESEFDAFGVGHSSTSISATLGMAVASSIKGETDRQHIAIIGDGALTGGEAFEGLNNAGVNKSNMLVILNDNGISIDKGVGAIKDMLLNVTTSRVYNNFKGKAWEALGVLGTEGPAPRKIIQKINLAIKNTFLKKSDLMESLNMRYFGPVDGHDVEKLVRIMKLLKDIPGPKLLHVITKKGKGFKQAEDHQTTYHAPGLFDKETGALRKEDTSHLPPKYQDVFGKTITDLAGDNKKIVAVSPAMLSGSSLTIMQKEFPDRVFDVGIAEQHAVTFSAGMAISGLKPFCNIYSTFLQRGYDQLIHDVAIQKLNVTFCIDRGGLVGEDGPTHHGSFDLAFLRLVPNITLMAPMNEMELRNMLYTCQKYDLGTTSIRYPRGRGFNIDWQNEYRDVEIGKGRELMIGDDVAIVSIGHVGNFAMQAATQLKNIANIGVYDMRFLKPYDAEMLHKIFKNYKNIISVEDGTVIGGLGSLLTEFKNLHNYTNKISVLGIPDQFVEHGKPSELYAICGYDVNGIIAEVKKVI
ncbi:MAG: 1-deoxy-D-xylulose-5-phosphate synthase [Bacteroidetes bacterium 4572_112]|nr:MAG: 1-deoxy-D-xylulose-5-phosphate synthase [Bacteroidetes bacterium 4572_112]